MEKPQVLLFSKEVRQTNEIEMTKTKQIKTKTKTTKTKQTKKTKQKKNKQTNKHKQKIANVCLMSHGSRPV